uniref:SJCHGC05897 protein n=1 Tax=Schistosoma japonicum TaxID=6182 RepID=Q5DHK4_SCHJA|nr:SJCHGC05897 protein [Schistosoma japonicum]
MLFDYCSSELRDVLLQEKNLLKHFKEELVSTTDIQLIRQKQESEIERLENEIKATRTFQSEQLNQFKEMSKQKQLKLENEALVVLDNVTKESKKITNNLIVEYVNKICKENEELYQDILSRLDKIKVMEIEKSNLQRQNDEIKRNRMFSKDLEYLEYKRSEGLSLLNS